MTKLPLILVLAIACGTESTDTATGTDSAQTDSGATDSGSDSGSDSGTTSSLDYCYQGCSRPADCATASVAYDADNYTCTASGACEYTGCNSTAECQSSLGATYVCTQRGGMDLCMQGCATATDCGYTNAGVLYDSSHYACNSGACDWTGCKSTAECAALGSNYTCADQSGLPTCLQTCVTPADCATAGLAYDADNYACSAGTCEYLGCNDDTECVDLLGAGAQCE
jgi:hypothetical protein